MKHDDLRSIAHNIADSFASGIGLPIGYYVTDVFGEADRSPEGFITIDFLKGTLAAGRASPSLAKAVGLYCGFLTDLCTKHGASVSQFKMLTASYSAGGKGGRAIVTIEDREGRRSIDEYVCIPLRHVKTVDSFGRLRTQRKPRQGYKKAATARNAQRAK